jgi:glucuronate isomerase
VACDVRSNGIPERRVTGGASDEEKYEAFIGTLPYALRNPLYHWSHLKLQRSSIGERRLPNPARG